MTDFYGLDVIIYVGYRASHTPQAIAFRKRIASMVRSQIKQQASTIRSQGRKIGYLEKHLSGYISQAQAEGVGRFIEESLPDGDRD